VTNGRRAVRLVYFICEIGTVFGVTFGAMFGEPWGLELKVVFVLFCALPIVSICLWRTDDALAMIGVGTFVIVLLMGIFNPSLR
jgi:hypothetical protein